MDRVPASEKTRIASDILSAWRAVTNGVVAKTAKDRHKYWNHWSKYASLCGVDPFLTKVPEIERDIVLTAFAARVRTGAYGRGTTIKISGVTDALASISKTIQLAGKPSPLYRAENVYHLPLQRLVEGFRREDPPSIPQLAVPITVPNLCYNSAMLPDSTPSRQATGQLALIAFYYLLRVGEYTKPKYVVRNGRQERTTRTKQFTVGNVGFFKNGKTLDRTSPLATLLTADAATLKISNQKNGRMGETIHQCAINKQECPIKALAHRVHHILSHGGNTDSLLCQYTQEEETHHVSSKDVIMMLRAAATTLKLQKQAIDPDLIGAHSLRSGGAMALKLHGYDDTTIRKMGRWTSDTFLQYIHNQIAHLSKDISSKMSIPLPFLNIAAIDT
jgi:hypothetical protein